MCQDQAPMLPRKLLEKMVHLRPWVQRRTTHLRGKKESKNQVQEIITHLLIILSRKNQPSKLDLKSEEIYSLRKLANINKLQTHIIQETFSQLKKLPNGDLELKTDQEWCKKDTRNSQVLIATKSHPKSWKDQRF